MFKPVEECIELFKQGVACDTGFSYMYNCEEVCFDDDDRYTFDIHSHIEDQLNEINEMSDMQIAQNDQRPYDEFTQVICPAYKA